MVRVILFYFFREMKLSRDYSRNYVPTSRRYILRNSFLLVSEDEVKLCACVLLGMRMKLRNNKKECTLAFCILDETEKCGHD